LLLTAKPRTHRPWQILCSHASDNVTRLLVCGRKDGRKWWSGEGVHVGSCRCQGRPGSIERAQRPGQSLITLSTERAILWPPIAVAFFGGGRPNCGVAPGCVVRMPSCRDPQPLLELTWAVLGLRHFAHNTNHSLLASFIRHSSQSTAPVYTSCFSFLFYAFCAFVYLHYII